MRFNVPYLAGNELSYIQDVIESGFFSGNGKYTKKCQKILEVKYQVPHVLITHSCTAALEMSAMLLDIKPGDQVILPSYTFCSTASAFLRNGAELVFAEVDPSTMNMSLDDALSKITKRTKAIVPIHYGGIGFDVDKLRAEVKDLSIPIVEDAAQGLNAKLDGQWLGTIADLGTISFHETKNLHCGLGGALFINDSKYFERAENIWERGTNRAKMFRGLVDKYSWVDVGSSFYPTELQAAFLCAQLEKIDENTAYREQLYNSYSEFLAPASNEGYFRMPKVDERCLLNFHSFFIICNSVADCDGLREYLVSNDIQAYIGYVPLHSSPVGIKLGYKPQDLPVTEEYAYRVLRLPFHNNLSVNDVELVSSKISSYYSK